MALLSASSVENLMAVALPVLMRDTFTSERPMALARSFERIFLSASTRSSRSTIIGYAASSSCCCRMHPYSKTRASA